MLAFSAISFAGFIALHLSASQLGYGVGGLLGGLLSSTAATLSFSRESRTRETIGEGLALGVTAACTMLVPRVLLVSLALNPDVARQAVAYLLPSFAVGVLTSWLLARRAGERTGIPSHESPLRLSAALQLALAFQIVLYLVDQARGISLTSGVVGSAAIAGLMDVDALTYSLSRLGRERVPADLAAIALSVGILSNTLLKLVLTLVLGRGRFRWLASACIATIALGLALPLGFVLSATP